MKIKLLLSSIAIFAISASAANPNATIEQVKIYINPGHGTYTGNDRPMATMGHGAAGADTAGFYESNTNMQKAYGLLDKLKEYGFTILRLKTGTPQRIDKNTIDYSKTSIEEGDKKEYTFSFSNKVYYDVNNQTPCHLIYTNEKTHEIIKEHLNESSMYGGYVEGVGPRYCPSIEDKIVRFADKERHQLFLEPESDYYPDMYLQGFSTSMPEDVQELMVHSLKGLENAKILKE